MMHIEPRERDSEKLQRIVDAAVVVFGQRGFHRATMQDIADEAGVGKGTTYLYFGSKEQLLEYIFEHAIQQYVAGAQAAAALTAPAPERLRLLIVGTLVGAQLKRGMARFVLEGTTGVSAELKQSLLRVHQTVLAATEALFEQGIAEGQIRPMDARIAAHTLNGTISSLAAALLWDDGSQAEPPGEAEAQLVAERLADGVMEVLALAPEA
jgi:AcrR family transcriptional regulator